MSHRRRSSVASVSLRTGSALLLLVIWALAAAILHDRVLPAPFEVASVLVRETASGTLPSAIGATLERVFMAFTAAMLAGAALGYVMGRSDTADALGDVWLIVLLNIPALVVMILAYVWFGLNDAAAIGAVALAKLPNVIVVVREGARTLDPKLEAVAKIYHFTAWMRLRDIVVPQLAPYLAAAARSGLSLVWKIVLVVELLGRPNGVGFELHTRFQLFDVAGILAYSLAFTGIMLAIEYLLLQPIERRARVWRVGAV